MSASSPQSHKRILIAALLLGLLSSSVFLALSWMQARAELRILQLELELTACTLRDTRQQLEAERIIKRKQVEMLRAQEKQSAGDANQTNSQLKSN